MTHVEPCINLTKQVINGSDVANNDSHMADNGTQTTLYSSIGHRQFTVASLIVATATVSAKRVCCDKLFCGISAGPYNGVDMGILVVAVVAGIIGTAFGMA